jgi:hypothetical protein
MTGRMLAIVMLLCLCWTAPLLAEPPAGVAALQGDALLRAASFGTDAVAESGRLFKIKGGDGAVRTLVQAPGEVNKKSGVFEYILNKKGQVEHQRFIPCGVVTGSPNQKAGC